MTNDKKQRAVLAAVQLPGVSDEDHEASLAELSRLVHTLGFEVIGTVTQRRATPAADAVLGEGKLKELSAYTGGKGLVTKNVPRKKQKKDLGKDEDDEDANMSADELARAAFAQVREDEEAARLPQVPEDQRAAFVIVDNEISPTQLKNLEIATEVEVMDRAGVIVEIFHRHAKTREARLQVEIARLRYLAPRLRLTRKASERQGAGIGAKGVGETAHELDKRRIRDRIAELGRELEEIHKSQSERRSRRSDQLKIALVGYTNAGKSSLMRALTGSEVLVQDKLFATLDTTIRIMQPEATPKILVSDTVGFIKKLPHDLVASFRSTLDEAADASLLLYVADASDKTFRSQLEVTREVTAEIGARDLPSRLILNKADRLSAEAVLALRREFPEAIVMSTHAEADVERLKRLINDFFEKRMESTELFLPYARSGLIGEIRRSVRVISETAGDDGMKVVVCGLPADVARLRARLGEN